MPKHNDIIDITNKDYRTNKDGKPCFRRVFLCLCRESCRYHKQSTKTGPSRYVGMCHHVAPSRKPRYRSHDSAERWLWSTLGPWLSAFSPWCSSCLATFRCGTGFQLLAQSRSCRFLKNWCPKFLRWMFCNWKPLVLSCWLFVATNMFIKCHVYNFRLLSCNSQENRIQWETTADPHPNVVLHMGFSVDDLGLNLGSSWIHGSIKPYRRVKCVLMFFSQINGKIIWLSLNLIYSRLKWFLKCYQCLPQSFHHSSTIAVPMFTWLFAVCPQSSTSFGCLGQLLWDAEWVEDSWCPSGSRKPVGKSSRPQWFSKFKNQWL